MTADKGWSLEYVLDLTWRQVFGLWERYWHRQSLNMAMAVVTNPFYSSENGEESTRAPKSHSPSVDATNMDAVRGLMAEGFPVKMVPRQIGTP